VVPRAMGPWRLLFSCLSKRRKEKVADLGFHGVTSIEPASPAQSKPAAQRPAQLAQEEIEECQNCATVLVPGANFCHHCGWKKGAVKATVVRTEAAEAAQLPGAVPAAKSQAAPATPQQALQLQSAAAEPAVTPVPKAAGAAPKAEASPAAEGGAIARTPPEAGNYVVELRRQNPAERFGFGWDVKKLEKDNVRVISKVLPGTLAAKWNERPPPGCEVRPGDTLVKVNGKQGRIELLTVELSKMYVVCEFQPHEPRDLGGAGDKQSDGAPQPSVPEATRPGAAPALAARAAEPVAPMAVATPAGAAAVTLPAAEAVAQLAMATPPAEAGSTLTVAMPAAGSPPPAQPAASSPKPVPAPLTEGEAPEPVLAKDQPPSPAAKDISSPSAKDLPPMPDEAPLPPQLPPEPLEAAAVSDVAPSASSCVEVIENPSETPELDHPSNNAAAEPADNAEIAEPKEASREPATGEAEAKNEKPASETTESFYVVVLQRGATSEKWGFQWDRQAMDTLNVKVIEGIAPNSLASDWNRRFPDRAARKGDQLTKVNGLRDPAGMAAEMKKNQVTCEFRSAQPRDGEAKVPELRPKPELTPLKLPASALQRPGVAVASG